MEFGTNGQDHLSYECKYAVRLADGGKSNARASPGTTQTIELRKSGFGNPNNIGLSYV